MYIAQSMDVGMGPPATEGARRATGVAGGPIGEISTDSAVKDPEVTEKTKQRTHTAKYKLRILQEVEKCPPGEIGAFLRREGLYSSNLTTWRRQLEKGKLVALTSLKRGKKADPDKASKKKMIMLERENEQLKRRLKQAEMIIDVQKKVSDLLGINLSPKMNEGKN